MEPLEYFLLDYAGKLPDSLVDKLRADLELHEDFVRQLWRRNEKLRQNVRRQKENEALQEGQAVQCCNRGEEAWTDGVITSVDPLKVKRSEDIEDWFASTWDYVRPKARGAASSIAAAQEANKRVAAEAYEAAMQAKLNRTCRRAEARITCMTRKAEKAEEESRKKKHIAILERARNRRELESVGSEMARTALHISDLEDAIRAEGCKFRDKEAERRAVAREVEALSCEVRAHRARAAKHLRTEQRIVDLGTELKATHANIASFGAAGSASE